VAHVEAEKRLRKIGTNALPELIEMLITKESRFSETKRRINGFGVSLFSVDSPPYEISQQALKGFNALGPLAAPAIPALTNLIGTGNDGVRCVYALACIGNEAVPALGFAVRSQDRAVRFHALTQLVSFGVRGTDLKPVERDCLVALNDQDRQIQWYALIFFERAGLITNRNLGKLPSSEAIRETARQLAVRLEKSIDTKR
jgi:hypothetical protein